MSDDRRTIGTTGAAGRGNRATTPSTASRSLAGGKAMAKKPVQKAKTAAKPATTPEAKKAAPSRRAPVAPPAKKSAARAAPKPAATAKPRLRAVTDDDAAEAAAAHARAQEKAAASTLSSSGIPLDEIVVAVIQAAQRVLGSDWDRRLAAFVAALRRRLSGEFEVDEFGFDPQITEVLTSAIEPIAEKWFRLQVRGVENIPSEGGALLVANHSGTLPIDAIVTSFAVHKHTGRHVRPLGADLVFALPFVGQIARKVGATLACAADAERLLTSGELAGVWPEGFKGIGKPYSERYKLQRFGRGGFVSSAMRAGVPIVPVSIVGAEEIYPLVGNVPSLARLLGLPYLPVTPFFPLLGPLGMIPLPSKWIIEFGEPIRTDAYEPDAADDPMLLFDVTDQVRETIQQTLYKLLVERGNAFF
jgi:1-acyl-sn-glycerol-3-phosphate acyltransferase